MEELHKKWQEELNKLSEIELPNSLDWADQNIPAARKYIEDTYSETLRAMTLGHESDFETSLEKYTKAWLRLWQRMAVDHFKKNDIIDVDMRYYRHLPDGYSMKWDSRQLGKKFTVYPRKPRSAKPGELWMTAGEMIRIHESPVIFSMLKEFDGWFDRDAGNRAQSMLERVLEHEKRNPPPAKLKMHRKDKHGAEWYK